MGKLDIYQTLGVFIPGYLFSFGLYIILGKGGFEIPLDISSVGGSLSLIVTGYVAGEIVQVFGKGLEWIWRKFRTAPTARMKGGDEQILAEGQRDRLIEYMTLRLGLPAKEPSGITEEEWFSYVRSVDAAVRHAKETERLDVFNAHYGMFRGIAATCLLLIAACFTVLELWRFPVVALATVFILAIFRMDRFDTNYARELFQRFLLISREDPKTSAQSPGQSERNPRIITAR